MDIQALIAAALSEDLGEQGDITTSLLISPQLQGRAQIIAKSDGVLCGANLVCQIGRAIDPNIIIQPLVMDEAAFKVGDVVLTFEGAIDSILKTERTALNFLGHLSGIASLTCAYVQRVAHTQAKILDTRKTTPGLRSLEKYDVYCGGAMNHRRGLWDMILVKENHLAQWQRPLSELMPMIRQKYPRQIVEIEVQTLAQLAELLPTKPSRVLLDHFSLSDMTQAVAMAKGSGVLLEASGNVSLETVQSIAETGVDFISVGALTHSAPCSDFSLLVVS